MTRLLADENFPMPATNALRALGYDVQTLLDLSQAGLAVPDDVVLSMATRADRCLLTLNRKDFIKLHTVYPSHAGIIVCKADSNFNRLAERIDQRLRQNPNVSGLLLRVQRPPV